MVSSVYCLDQFTVSGGLVNSVINPRSLHNSARMSFNSAVSFKIGISVSNISSVDYTYRQLTKWSCATEDHLSVHCETLHHFLSMGTSTCAKIINRCNLIYLFHELILDTFFTSGKLCSPYPSNKLHNKRDLIGRHGLVKPCREV